MNTNRLGCLSPTAILASLLTLIVIIGLEFTSGNSLFSAGSLNAQAGKILGGESSHATTRECGKCHVAFWERARMADRCVACHTEISAQLQDVSTMHGAMLKGQTPTCRACHPEHRGANAPLTEIRSDQFPHDTVGYSLRGHQRLSNGQAFTCADCHGKDIAHFDLATCSTCHKQMDAVFMQAHNLAYGTDCLACHDGIDSFGKNFNHSRLAFKLDGKHANPICSKCHVNARTTADFKLAAQDCATCHRQDDPHGGRFGQDCGACHTPAGWIPAKFNHNLSAFKLEGKHAEVECTICHLNGIYKGTPSTCFACHQKDDQHNGKFGQDCGTCHTPKDWKEATFDHNLAAFKLDGAHINVACEKCHVNGVFKGTPLTCAGCHGDPAFHAGMFRSQACSKCHNTSAWSPGIYRGPHPDIASGEGGSGVNHGGQGCRSCHTVNLSTATCTACHDNNNPRGD